MEKYGFVYIWFDRKHKRYYIGMHWGNENDGYICSSNWMRDSYTRRPEDFKRKIIEKIYTNRKDLYKREKYWLSLIKDEELRIKYYNLRKEVNDIWLSENENIKRKDRISQKTKEAMYRPEVRAKYLAGLETRDNGASKPEVRQKKRESMIKTMAEKFPVENRYNPPEFNSEEYKQNMAKSVSESWKSRDKEVIGNKISESLKLTSKSRSEYMSKTKWWNNGIINTRSITPPGPDWVKGRK
jgi:hypothetical protein